MPLSEGQLSIAQSERRFRVAICGRRRWGKTHLSIREIARHARLPDQRVFYIAPSYRMAKQIVWDQIKTRLSTLRWIDRVNESDLNITLVNGSKIYLRGADNYDSLRGVGVNFLVMDEFAMIDAKAWTEVLRPTLSDTGGRALFISTPQGQGNWAYDLYQRHLTDPDNWASWQYTTLSGGRIPESEIAQARRDLDARTFRQEYEATFETHSNRVYYAFDRAENVRPYTGARPKTIYVGLDFNVGQMSAVICTRERDTIHVIDEIALLSSNTTEVASEIRSRYPDQSIWVYPDPAGSARKTSAQHGVTDHTILQNAGFTVKAPHAHNPVRDGINAVNSKLCNSLGERSLFVAPECRNTIDSLDKFTYKPGSNQPDKDSGLDHMADALRYYVDYVFPVKRAYDPDAQRPQRWGHQIS